MSRSAPGINWSISSTTRDLRAERVIDGGHFKPDDAAAQHQQALGDVGDFERAGRIHDAGVAAG